jgi:hypothetical protein
MPWYQNKSVSGKWGWHWTMNHFNPDQMTDGKQQAASQYRPLIGLYDSSDPDVLEYHVQLMKIAGIGGVAVDWYGREDYNDYASNHKNTQSLINVIQKAGLKFTLVYEDQTVTQLIKGNVYPASDAVKKGRELMQWLETNWFASPYFLKIDGHPVFMVFGPQYYKDQDWVQMFAPLKTQPDFLTLMFKKGPAVGGYSWPTPQRGEEKSWDELDMFEQRAANWPLKIEVAYPRFNDIYSQAGMTSFPPIQDYGGATYEKTLARALRSKAPIVQIATWNDWGEGTQIEPSVEFGYRDLEATQRVTHAPYSAQDLRLPFQLYELRKKSVRGAATRRKLNAISDELLAGDCAKAKRDLAAFKN